MPRNIQSLNCDPSQIRLQVKRNLNCVQPKPFRNCTNENARDEFRQQRSMAAAKARQLLPKQEFSPCQCAESRIRATIAHDFFTAQNSGRVRMREHNQNDAGIAFGLFLKRLVPLHTRTQFLGLLDDPGRKGKWINTASQFADEPGHFVQLNDFRCPANYWLPAHNARFMDLRFHTAHILTANNGDSVTLASRMCDG